MDIDTQGFHSLNESNLANLAQTSGAGTHLLAFPGASADGLSVYTAATRNSGDGDAVSNQNTTNKTNIDNSTHRTVMLDPHVASVATGAAAQAAQLGVQYAQENVRVTGEAAHAQIGAAYSIELNRSETRAALMVAEERTKYLELRSEEAEQRHQDSIRAVQAQSAPHEQVFLQGLKLEKQAELNDARRNVALAKDNLPREHHEEVEAMRRQLEEHSSRERKAEVESIRHQAEERHTVQVRDLQTY